MSNQLVSKRSYLPSIMSDFDSVFDDFFRPTVLSRANVTRRSYVTSNIPYDLRENDNGYQLSLFVPTSKELISENIEINTKDNELSVNIKDLREDGSISTNLPQKASFKLSLNLSEQEIDTENLKADFNGQTKMLILNIPYRKKNSMIKVNMI